MSELPQGEWRVVRGHYNGDDRGDKETEVSSIVISMDEVHVEK